MFSLHTKDSDDKLLITHQGKHHRNVCKLILPGKDSGNLNHATHS